MERGADSLFAVRELSSQAESADSALASVLGSGETEVVMLYMMNEVHWTLHRRVYELRQT